MTDTKADEKTGGKNDVKTVLDWANSLCAQAFTEARGGDRNLLNRIGSNAAMKLFLDNVHGLKSVQDTQFAAYYPAQWKEITRLHEAYLRDEQLSDAAGRLSAVEAGLDELRSMIGQLLESNQSNQSNGSKQPKPAPKAAKKSASSSKLNEAESESDVDAEAEAETEEPAEDQPPAEDDAPESDADSDADPDADSDGEDEAEA